MNSLLRRGIVVSHSLMITRRIPAGIRVPVNPGLSNRANLASERTKTVTSENKKSAKQADQITDSDFRLIYIFPYIRHARAVCRLKLFQTGVTLTTVPVSGILAALGMIDFEKFTGMTMIAALACAMVYVMGSFFRSLVGIMYVNGKGDILKVAHLTFWGGRRDVQIPVDDIVPYGDSSENPRNIYFTLKRYSAPKEKLYYILRFGGVQDKKMFVSILGEHS